MRTSLATVVALATFAVGGAGVAAATATQSSPAPGVLKTELATSSKLESINISTSIPPLSQIGTFDFSYNPSRPGCTTSQAQTSPANDVLSRCVYGDVKAKRTIVLFGDSQAEMWLPSFDLMAHDLGWKVIYFAKAGCAPWVNTAAGDYTIAGGLTHKICQSFVANEIADAIAAHPKVIIPVGLEGTVGTHVAPTAAVLSSQIKALVSQLAPAHATVLFMKPLAEYVASITSQTPTTCLTAHQGSLVDCTLGPDAITKDPVYAGLMDAATTTTTPVVNTALLFCSSTKCPLGVKGTDGVHLVYNDPTHINRWYSQYMSKAFAALVRPFLPGK